jgi:predicted dehydrogenase
MIQIKRMPIKFLKFGYKHFSTIATLIHAVDVIDIVTPTLSHYKCAKVAIKSGKHVFIEKPISNTIEEAEEIITLANEYNVKDKWDMWNDLILLLSQLKT